MTWGETTFVAPKEQANHLRISQAKELLSDAALESAYIIVATKEESQPR